MQVPLPFSQVISSVWQCRCCYCSVIVSVATTPTQTLINYKVELSMSCCQKRVSEELGNPDLGKLSSPSRSSRVADRIQQVT